MARTKVSRYQNFRFLSYFCIKSIGFDSLGTPTLASIVQCFDGKVSKSLSRSRTKLLCKLNSFKSQLLGQKKSTQVSAILSGVDSKSSFTCDKCNSAISVTPCQFVFLVNTQFITIYREIATIVWFVKIMTCARLAKTVTVTRSRIPSFAINRRITSSPRLNTHPRTAPTCSHMVWSQFRILSKCLRITRCSSPCSSRSSKRW